MEGAEECENPNKVLSRRSSVRDNRRIELRNNEFMQSKASQ
jgi:hypothetical protein